jgi:UDP-N-acetyl-2-amino-2-deoxyglucuronate dehydrogenase
MDGGALMNQGFHYADLLLWCMGPIAEVSAVTATQAHAMEAEDCALAIVRFESGALGTITASTAVVPNFGQRLEISGMSGRSDLLRYSSWHLLCYSNNRSPVVTYGIERQVESYSSDADRRTEPQPS